MNDQPRPFQPAKGRPYIADLLIRNAVAELRVALAELEEQEAAS